MSDLEEKIRTLTKEKGIKMEAIYSYIGMSNAGFYKMLRNNTMKVETLEKIAELLDIPIASFFGIADTKSKEQEREILNLQTQVEQLNELNAVYRKLIEKYEDDNIITHDINSSMWVLKKCFEKYNFDFSDQEKEKIKLYVRENVTDFTDNLDPVFERYDRPGVSSEILEKKLSEAVMSFIIKKKVLK